MVFDLIIPIENSEESESYIKKMYCLKCRERGGCYPKHNYPIIENGYQYDVISCECSKCSGKFDLKFFNLNSYTNLLLKQKLSDSDSAYTLEPEENNKKPHSYLDFLGY